MSATPNLGHPQKKERIAMNNQWQGDDFSLPCGNCGEPYVEHVTPDDDMGLVLCPDEESTLATLRDVLWPPENPDAPWSPDTIEYVAEILTRAGFGRPVSV